MNREELIKKLELSRVGNGTQTYNDVVLTLTKEETLELLKYIEQLEKDLEVLDILKKKMTINIYYCDNDDGCEVFECIAYNGDSLNIETYEEFKKIKEWLENE